MSTSWSRNGPYEKSVRSLCAIGDATPDSEAGDIFKVYNHCWTPIKLANFRKHFKRVVEDAFAGGNDGSPTIPNPISIQPAEYGPGSEVRLQEKSTDVSGE